MIGIKKCQSSNISDDAGGDPFGVSLYNRSLYTVLEGAFIEAPPSMLLLN